MRELAREIERDPRFEAVRTEFARNFDRREDVGAAVALVYRGDLVVDLWGGHTDEERSAEWQRDSIVNVFSVTKTMTAALILLAMFALYLPFPVVSWWRRRTKPAAPEPG